MSIDQLNYLTKVFRWKNLLLLGEKQPNTELPSLSSRVEKKSGEKKTVEEKHAYKDWLNERQG